MNVWVWEATLAGDRLASGMRLDYDGDGPGLAEQVRTDLVASHPDARDVEVSATVWAVLTCDGGR